MTLTDVAWSGYQLATRLSVLAVVLSDNKSKLLRLRNNGLSETDRR